MGDLRVLVYCYFPPRAEHLAGGAQQVVHDLLRGLASRQIRLDVICPRTEADDDGLLAHESVRVHPVLFEPGTGVLTPYERQLNLQHLAYLAEGADVIVAVDRVFPLEVDQPVLLLLNNFSYGTEVDSVFSFTWDSITVSSAYLAEAVAAVAGPELWEGDQRPVRIANPGIDQAHFQPSSTDQVRSALGIESGRYLLFPHRPDPDKGFDIALAAVHSLRERGEDFRLLVPTPPRSVRAVREQEQRYVRTIQDRVREAGLADAVVLHPWVPHRMLPAYYSLAECCLVPSRLPEGFGLSVVQAISCGTPVVSTAAGAIPDLLPPDHGLTVVPFDDIETTVDATLTAVASGHGAVQRGARCIGRRYRIDAYVDAIADHLASTTKSWARYVPSAPRPIRPAPWWREAGAAARWHDYLMTQVTPTAAERRHLMLSSDGTVDSAALARGLLVGQLTNHPEEEAAAYS